METLDLHGMKHHQVEVEIENFILIHPLPVRIITGNSYVMKQILKSVLDKYNFRFEVENYWNLGSMIVIDS